MSELMFTEIAIIGVSRFSETSSSSDNQTVITLSFLSSSAKLREKQTARHQTGRNNCFLSCQRFALLKGTRTREGEGRAEIKRGEGRGVQFPRTGRLRIWPQ